jgi:hypothetical protein
MGSTKMSYPTVSESLLAVQVTLKTVSPTLSPTPLGAGGPTRSVSIWYWYGVPSALFEESTGMKLMSMGTAAKVACAEHASTPLAGGLALSGGVGGPACQPTRSRTRTLKVKVCGVLTGWSTRLPVRRPQQTALVKSTPRSDLAVQSEPRLAQTCRLSLPVNPSSVTLKDSTMSARQSE